MEVKGNAKAKNGWNKEDWRRSNLADGWNCKRH
jgi:hypothetical protein